MTRMVILASGNGSNAQAIIDAVSDGVINAEVTAVVTNIGEAFVVELARRAHIPVFILDKNRLENRQAYDARLRDVIVSLRADVVVLAGWMRILTMTFLGGVGAPVINLHPALPGEFPGTHAIERAFQERTIGRSYSGVMIHLVPDEGIDDGPILASRTVELFSHDSLEEFSERMHRTEHQLLVETLADYVKSLETTTTGVQR